MVSVDNSGKKFDTGKAPTLRGCLAYFAKAITAVASVSAYGAKKYNNTDYAPNWKKVEGGLGRYSDADARHLLSEAVDGLYDPESHLLHAAHHAWNALARLELLLATNPLEQSGLQPFTQALKERNAPQDPTPSTPHTVDCKCYQHTMTGATDRRINDLSRRKYINTVHMNLRRTNGRRLLDPK